MYNKKNKRKKIGPVFFKKNVSYFNTFDLLVKQNF